MGGTSRGTCPWIRSSLCISAAGHVKTRTHRRSFTTAVHLTHAGSFKDIERWLPKFSCGDSVGLHVRTDRHEVLES